MPQDRRAYDVRVPDPATWRTPQECSPGTRNLADAIRSLYPALVTMEGAYGCFNRRKTSAGGRSVHGDGRALDVGHGYGPNKAQRDQAMTLVARLAAHAQTLGVQRIIYNRSSWTYMTGWRPVSSATGAHLDHIHIEQTAEAAWTRPLSALVAVLALGEQELPMPPIYFRNAAGTYWCFDPYTGKTRHVTDVELYDLLPREVSDRAVELDDEQIHKLTGGRG